jgi:hypothetical protein
LIIIHQEGILERVYHDFLQIRDIGERLSIVFLDASVHREKCPVSIWERKYWVLSITVGGRPVREVVIHCMGSMLEPSRKKIEWWDLTEEERSEKKVRKNN